MAEKSLCDNSNGNYIFQSLNHVEVNLKPQLFIKRGYYILPNPSTALKQGKSMCKWSSCREGCTSDMYQCYQVRVQYIDESYRNNSFVDEYRDREWKNLSRFDTLEVEVSLNQGCNHRYDRCCN